MKFSKFLAASCFAVALFPAGQAAQAADLPSFIQDGVLKICTAGDFPPMQFYKSPEDKEMVGYEIDVVNALAKHWNAKTEYVVSDFKGLLPSLDAQRCGLVASGILILPARLERYDGVGHFSTSVVLVTPANSDIKSPDQLSGQTVAIEAGTNYEKTAAEMNKKFAGEGKPEMVVQTYPGSSGVIEQILIGRAAATITQDTTAAYRGAQVPGRLAVPYVYPDPEVYGLYIRKSPDDLAKLKQALKAIKASGEIGAALSKWNLRASSADVLDQAN